MVNWQDRLYGKPCPNKKCKEGRLSIINYNNEECPLCHTKVKRRRK